MNSIEFKKTFKTKFLTGLFVAFPLVLTLLAVKWLFVFLDSILGDILYDILGHRYVGLGLVLAFLFVLGVGTLATTVLGRKYIDWIEGLLLRLPVFKSFYSTFKQLGDAFSPGNRSVSFKRFVIVEYPRVGVHSFGFLTKECIVRNKDGVDECYNTVYIPTNHLYFGEIALIKKDEVIQTDISIEEGIKIILSAGIAAPNVVEHGSDNSFKAHRIRPAGQPPAPVGASDREGAV